MQSELESVTASGVARPKRLGGRGLEDGVPQRDPGAEPRGEAPRSQRLYTIYSCEKSLFSLQFTEFDQPGLGTLSRV